MIIDEIDGILDTDNLSLCEIANVLKSKNIKVLFISSKKGSQKLKDVIDNEIVFKIEYLNKQEIYKYFKPLYPKVKAPILNSLIAKIPVVGDILIGKKVGEGVFGISFKVKGLPNDLKTTVNPIKTLTPRFITRALENAKKKDIK